MFYVLNNGYPYQNSIFTLYFSQYYVEVLIKLLLFLMYMFFKVIAMFSSSYGLRSLNSWVITVGVDGKNSSTKLSWKELQDKDYQ